MNIEKMLIVPARDDAPIKNQINQLDEEMQKILKDKRLSPDAKWKLYNQVLHRHNVLQAEKNKPFQVEIKQTVESMPDKRFLEEVKTRLPPSKRLAGSRLLEHIEKAKNFSWNDKKEMVIDGRPIPHTNLESLVNYAIRDVRRSPPRGWEYFAKWVADVNLPQSVIANKRGREYINALVSPLRQPNFDVEESPLRWASKYGDDA